WGYPGGSPDVPLSYTRVDEYTKEMQERYGVEMLDSIEAVAEHADGIILNSMDGRSRIAEFSRIAPFGKPVYINKPFAVSTADAAQLIELAERYGTPLLSCSALRYSDGI